jgi:hypothetical protein
MVEMVVSTDAKPVEAEAFDSDGKFFGRIHQQLGHADREMEHLRLIAPLESNGIAFVVLRAPASKAYLHELWYRTDSKPAVVAEALDISNRSLGTYMSDNDNEKFEIEGEGVRAVLLRARGGSFCLTKVCAVMGLADDERNEREEMLRNVVDGLSHWEADGEVLPAWTNFRLKIITSLRKQTYAPLGPSDTTKLVTQYAYFRTEGPPGLAQLTLPVGHPLADTTPTETTAAPISSVATPGPMDAPIFNAGVNDLTRYVAQTIPPTVPNQPGEKPLLPRPVYCAYDVGVKFNENYVEQMYASAGRDLSLYIFDNNDQPARDSFGRLLVTSNRWGRQTTLSLSRSEERWLRHLNSTTCATIDLNSIARDQELQSTGQILAGDTLYEGRLLPLLLHDNFTDYLLNTVATTPEPLRSTITGGWLVADNGTSSSQWVVREEGNPASRYIEQIGAVSLGTTARNSAFPGGTFLIVQSHSRLDADSPHQPAQWTDYRASAHIRSSGENPIGLSIRWNNGTGYLFYMDHKLNHRRLIRVDPGGASIVAEVSGSYQSGLDSHISFDTMGDLLRVFVDGEKVFEARDATYQAGGIALFPCDSPGASFRDIRVDDLRVNAPVVYRFKFTTSRFANFMHHIHSFRDLTFIGTLPDLNEMSNIVAAAVDLSGQAGSTPPSPVEAAAYEDLATRAVGTASHQQTNIVDVTRIEHNSGAIGYLIRTSEPIDWKRTRLVFSKAARQSLLPKPPDGPRLIAVSFAMETTAVPVNESATILVSETTNFTNWHIDFRLLPDAANSEPGWQTWYTFGVEPPRAAGRRVRIFALPGNTPPQVSGEDYLFFDNPHGGSQPKFPLPAVDLRLVAPNGRIAHMRRFLSTQAYTPSPIKILRSGDGTGFILIKPEMATFTPAEYQLRLEFKRDNTASDQGSLVLSENGDTSAEIAQLDIPWTTHELSPGE